MSLSNPDTRRALRAVIQSVLALALIGLLYWITGRVSNTSSVLSDITRGTLIILALGELFYGAENVTRAIKLTGPAGFGAEFGGDAPQAAQAVATAAQETANVIKDVAPPAMPEPPGEKP
jgi:hypothetical protein